MLVSFFEYLVGGFDNSIKTLLAFMIADVITGIRKAYMGKSEKSSKGYLDSRVMREGGIRKILVFIVIYVATVTGQLVSPNSPIVRNLTISYYIATEALSVLENAAACGIKLPKPLIEALERLKNEDST
jgi:toxin secretion/phage lysis holin